MKIGSIAQLVNCTEGEAVNIVFGVRDAPNGMIIIAVCSVSA